MSTPQTSPSTNPTKYIYLDQQGRQMNLNWTKPMPNNGFLGEVTYLSFVKKPIQVFAAIDQEGYKIWQFQAQDGSFLCSLKVRLDQNTITFFDTRKGNFPNVTLYAPDQDSIPTKRTYVDDENRRMIFNWTKRMPDNGHLGDVTYLSFVQKPIQVFAVKVDQQGTHTWQFQAQDGSFLLSMRVDPDQKCITFLDRKKGDFPLVTVCTIREA